MRRYWFVCFLVFFLCKVGWAQMKYANNLFDERDYQGAIPLYERVLKKDSSNLEALEKIAFCHKSINEYEDAQKYYALAITFDDVSTDSYLNYGQLLKSDNKINQARAQFQEYINRNPQSLLGKILLNSCDQVINWTSVPREFTMKNLEPINTPYLEISPFPFEDGLLFTSDKYYADKAATDEKEGEDGLTFDIYRYSPGNAAEMIAPFSREVNTRSHTEGPIYINSDGTMAYYSKVFDRKRNVTNQIEIHIASFDGSSWKKEAPFQYNSREYAVTNPVISVDGQSLYFASDMEGGYGSMDIYYCVKTDEGWGEPTNLGAGVNSEGHEIPSYIDKNDVLYFSSDYHPGFGGFDVFKVSKANGWKDPENMKSPFNSSKDDMGFILMREEEGYLASNRDGGKGLDDIYYFYKNDFSDSASFTDVSGVFQLDTLPLMNTVIHLLDENDELVQTAITNERGEFRFKNVPAHEEYSIMIDEDAKDIPDDAQLFITNQNYDKLFLMDRVKKGLFKFETLSRDETESLSLMDEEDVNGLPSHRLIGQITYEKLGMDIPEGLEVMIVDDEGQVIGIAKTDHLGKFIFEKLDVEEQYLFKMAEDDPDIRIAVINDKGELMGNTRRNSDGTYIYHKFTVNPSKQPDVRGVFKYGKLPASDVALQLLDENDEVVQVVTTNFKGEFKFEQLEEGKNYRVVVSDSAAAAAPNGQLFVKDVHSGLLLPVSKLANGAFNFQTLETIPVESLSQVEEDDFTPLPTTRLAGMVYGELPLDHAEGLGIQVVDDEGNVIAQGKTDRLGNFIFENLPADEQYLIQLMEDDPNLKIRIIGERGHVIGNAERNPAGVFVYHKFTVNPALNPDITGIFKYGELPADKVKLNLLNSEDEIVQFTVTNKDGKFEFKNLKEGESYRVRVDESEGEQPSNAQLYVKDKYTGLALPVSKLSSGEFSFNTLPSMPTDEMAVMEEEDLDLEIVPRLNLTGMVYGDLPLDKPGGIELLAMNDEGMIIARGRTDAKGRFEFKNLPADETIMFKIPEEDSQLNIRIIGQGGRVLAETQRNEDGVHVYHKLHLNTAARPNLRGKFQYGNLPADGIRLNLMDETDEIVATVVTNRDGLFEFKQLDANHKYRIEVDKSAGEIPDNAELFILDQATGMLLPVNRLSNGSFEFRTLSALSSDEMAMMEEVDETPNISRFSFLGQLYTQLPMDLPEGMDLMIVDDQGRVIAKAKTDASGKFKFQELPLDDQYLIKLLEDDPNIELKIISATGHNLGTLKRNARGEFVYNRKETKPDTPPASTSSHAQTASASTVNGTALRKSVVITVCYYSFDNWELNKTSKANLDELIAAMKKDPKMKVSFRSHTDSFGHAAYNLYLSDKRSEAAARYLFQHGIARNRVTTSGAGDKELVNNCKPGTSCTKAQHAKNRRTDLRVVD